MNLAGTARKGAQISRGMRWGAAIGLILVVLPAVGLQGFANGDWSGALATSALALAALPAFVGALFALQSRRAAAILATLEHHQVPADTPVTFVASVQVPGETEEFGLFADEVWLIGVDSADNVATHGTGASADDGATEETGATHQTGASDDSGVTNDSHTSDGVGQGREIGSTHVISEARDEVVMAMPWQTIRSATWVKTSLGPRLELRHAHGKVGLLPTDVAGREALWEIVGRHVTKTEPRM